MHMAQRIPLPLTVSCFSKIQIGFAFLVPADLGSPEKRAVKRVCVCVCRLKVNYSPNDDARVRQNDAATQHRLHAKVSATIERRQIPVLDAEARDRSQSETSPVSRRQYAAAIRAAVVSTNNLGRRSAAFRRAAIKTASIVVRQLIGFDALLSYSRYLGYSGTGAFRNCSLRRRSRFVGSETGAGAHGVGRTASPDQEVTDILQDVVVRQRPTQPRFRPRAMATAARQRIGAQAAFQRNGTDV